MKKLLPIVLLWLFQFSFVSIAQTNSSSAADRQFTLSEITRPEKQIPFKEVIQATTHHRILDFDTNNPAHVELKNRILRAAKLAGERAAKDSLRAARANEAGNHIEPYVRTALRDCGLPARVPVNSAGEAQVTGSGH